MAQHGVELVELFDAVEQFRQALLQCADRNAVFLGDFFLLLGREVWQLR